MAALWPIILLALIYARVLLTQISGVSGSLLNPTLDGIADLLGTPAGAAAGWVHGERLRSLKQLRQFPSQLSFPGLRPVRRPLGLLLYLLVRSIGRPGRGLQTENPISGGIL
jgi:hypothetical protein